MFLGPLEASKPWSLQNIEGVYRFLKKVWREFIDLEGEVTKKVIGQMDSEEFGKLLHETISKVTESIEGLRFNTAISQLMICMNGIQKEEQISKDSAKIFLQLLAPFAPHISEELWKRLGGHSSISQVAWPKFDSEKCIRSQLKIIVQVNGKVRDEITVSANAEQGEIITIARKASKAIPFLSKGEIVKEIYVPQKIVNFVVRS